MKRTTISVVLVIAVCVVLTSCGTLFTKGGSDYRSGVASYEKQEYVSALRYLSQALAVNPELIEADELFPQVFIEGTAYYKNQAASNEQKQDPQAADQVYYAYTHLQQLHEIARNAGRNDLEIEDFTTNVQDARLASGDLWFVQAQNLREQGDRENLKKAVIAFETARDRNPDLPNIDSLIEQTISDATVTLAVVAHGSGVKDFSQLVQEDVTEIIGSNRFVEVIQDADFTPGPESMVGPTDIAIMTAMSKGWDYVLEVYAYQGFDEINTETPVQLPSEAPLFSGIKKTIGYQHNTSLSVRLFSVKNGVTEVYQDQVREIDGPYKYTFSYVNAEGLRELNLGGTGKKNLRFVTSNTSDTATDTAIGTLRWDYENIAIPPEVSDPTDQTQWIAYFASQYHDFETFAENESNKELFYAIEVVHHRPSDTYFMIGPSLDEAIRRSKINSAIMNALSYTGRTLIAQEKEAGGYGYLKAGELAANAIKGLL
jgi:tetratricopeptide (TPR) repeat protein